MHSIDKLKILITYEEIQKLKEEYGVTFNKPAEQGFCIYNNIMYYYHYEFKSDKTGFKITINYILRDSMSNPKILSLKELISCEKYNYKFKKINKFQFILSYIKLRITLFFVAIKYWLNYRKYKNIWK